MSNQKNVGKKPWGGRFTELVEAFTESISFDARLYQQDIQGSIAHSKMLAKIGVISQQEAQQIETGLIAIREQIDAGEFEWSTELEDVHMNIEARLTQAIGEAGKKLHTGRSKKRNRDNFAWLHPFTSCAANYTGSSLTCVERNV